MVTNKVRVGPTPPAKTPTKRITLPNHDARNRSSGHHVALVRAACPTKIPPHADRLVSSRPNHESRGRSYPSEMPPQISRSRRRGSADPSPVNSRRPDRYKFRPGPSDPSCTIRAKKNGRPRHSSRMTNTGPRGTPQRKTFPAVALYEPGHQAPQTRSGSFCRGQGQAKQSTGHSFPHRPGRLYFHPWPTPNVCVCVCVCRVAVLGACPFAVHGRLEEKRRRDAVQSGRKRKARRGKEGDPHMVKRGGTTKVASFLIGTRGEDYR